MPETGGSRLRTLSEFGQVLSVVVGVVLSIQSFNAAREKEAVARMAEVRKEALEAAAPLLQLRQKYYLETIRAAQVLATPDTHSPEQLKQAETRFWELYWGELSLVEDEQVEKAMMEMGRALAGKQPLSQRRTASYRLAHALRGSLLESWQVGPERVGRLAP